MRRVSGAIAVFAVGAAIAACGGSSRSNAYHAYNPSSGKQKTALLGGGSPQDSSAGTVQNYQPTGQLIADNGFRPATDGFAFQNYGNDVQPQNMTPTQVADLFGTQVCSNGDASNCQLIPPAQVWMDNQNTAMAGGHCMGFSVAAIRFYDGNQKVSDFGSVNQTDQLSIQGDTTLQSTIAEDWTFQNLPQVQAAEVKGTPNDVLDKLISALKDKSEYYTIAIFKRDGTGGHAITPYAVEDQGNGKENVLVYDNNFPGVTREISFDRNANTWSYFGGPNPSDTNEQYDGDAQTKSLSLFPTSPGEQQQPCPFCNGQNTGSSSGNSGNTGNTGNTGTSSTAGAAPSVGSVLPAAQQFNEISLNGDPSNHAHIVLTDAQGRTTGFIDGKQVNDIPGVVVDRNLGNQDWAESPEPTYHIPVTENVTVAIDASALTKPDTEELNLVGPGIDTLVQDIKLEPGQKDEIQFNTDGLGYVYKTDVKQAESPILAAGVQGKQADYGFAVKAINVKGGSNVALKLDRANEQLDIDTAGTAGAGDYVVSVYREDDQGKTSWTSSNEPIHLEGGQIAHVDYGSTRAGGPMKLEIRGSDGSLVKTIEIPEDKKK
jgi:hypothetical protein